MISRHHAGPSVQNAPEAIRRNSYDNLDRNPGSFELLTFLELSHRDLIWLFHCDAWRYNITDSSDISCKYGSCRITRSRFPLYYAAGSDFRFTRLLYWWSGHLILQTHGIYINNQYNQSWIPSSWDPINSHTNASLRIPQRHWALWGLDPSLSQSKRQSTADQWGLLIRSL